MLTEESLETRCLEEVIEKFSWFHDVYTNRDKADLSTFSNYDFLKRYSFHILERLNENRCLKSEYLDFLLNKYLEVLDTRWMGEWPWERVSQKLAEIGTKLKDVTFCNRPWAKLLCHLPNLKKISHQRFCTDEFLNNLPKFCNYVKILDIRNSTGLSNEGFINFCSVPDETISIFHESIKVLFIENTLLEDHGVASAIQNMPNLEKLDYERLPQVLRFLNVFEVNSSMELEQPYNLVHLNITNIENREDVHKDCIKVCLAVCAHLKILSCDICYKQDLQDLKFWSHLQELVKLELNYILAGLPLELNEIFTLNFRKLTVLKIQKFCIPLCVLAQNCPHLKSLIMTDVILQHSVNDYVPVFYNLKKISLIEFVVTDSALSQAITRLLASSPNLNQLHFEFCELDHSDIKTQILRCCELCNLIIMDFMDSSMGFAFLRDILLTCSTLKCLRLHTLEVEFKEEVSQLKKIAASLPNKPQICSPAEFYSPEYDVNEFRMNEYDDHFP